MRSAPRFAPFLLVLALALLASLTPARAALLVEEIQSTVPDFDSRAWTAPAAAALARAATFDGATVRWNRFGTVEVLHRPGGWLEAGLTGDPESEARSWLRRNRELFGLSLDGVSDLVLIRDSQLSHSSARVFLFGQTVGGVAITDAGHIKVGIVDGKIFWAASSAVGDLPAPAAATLGPTQAWRAAAAFAGVSVPATAISSDLRRADGWNVFDVADVSIAQRSREVAFRRGENWSVPAWETNVVDVAPSGAAIAYTAWIDALSGEVLAVHNRLQQALDEPREPAAAETVGPISCDDSNPKTCTYTGDYPPDQDTQCGPCHGPVTVGAGFTRAVATAFNLLQQDIFINLHYDDASGDFCDNIVAQGDLLLSPEQLTYTPGGGVPAGDYYVEVCPYDATQPAPTTYAGTLTLDDLVAGVSGNPQWKFFPLTPDLDYATTDNRELGCWNDEIGGVPVPGCDRRFADLSAHNMAWDWLPTSGQPSLTTIGNNARSTRGWSDPLGGGGESSATPAPSRVYEYPWNNTWFVEACNPLTLVGEGPDTDAALANLFTIHNVEHDWAYHLGLRETNGAAQLSNFGQTDATRESDSEFGGAQAGAVDGGAPAYQGRDNANQITLQDGVPPLTNMYLWQTIGGAIVTPCVDGDFDGSVISHEYGHLIQNRMVDPDAGLGGDQGRAMGESWSDLTAVAMRRQLLLERGTPGGDSLFSVGAYVTGDLKGIRNYLMSDSPLNYGDVGYDYVCSPPLTDVDGNCGEQSQVHADGEIWSATNYDIRQALIAKYDATFAEADDALQVACANGEVPPALCPGNRRWSQIMHDGMILSPPAPSMLDARDAYLAADLARSLDTLFSWPSNQAELWEAFARRGMGVGASTTDADDFDPVPDFASPVHDNAEMQFVVRDAGSNTVIPDAEIFVGVYEARATPIGPTASFVAGDYDFVVRAPGYGHHRFQRTMTAGESVVVTFHLVPNLASGTQGATAISDLSGVDGDQLIDDTEETDWEVIDVVPTLDADDGLEPGVTVDLGAQRTFQRAQVSGMLELNVGVPTQNRFSSIHRFRLSACDATGQLPGYCAAPPLHFVDVFTSAPDAFPSSNLRPLVPDSTIREFDLGGDVTATHVRIVALDNKCTGTTRYQGYPWNGGGEDSDLSNSTNCLVGGSAQVSAKNDDVRIAELQLFGAATSTVSEVAGLPFIDGFESGDTSKWSQAVP